MKKIMIICHYGLGSSSIIEKNLLEFLSERKEEYQVFHIDLQAAAHMSADIYIFTQAISSTLDFVPKDKAIILENILDKDELQNKFMSLLAQSG